MKNYGLTRFQWYFIRLISWATLFNSFVLFEETVIDRSSWREWLPGYRHGEACIWDLAAAIVFAVAVLLVLRNSRSIAAGD